MNIYLDTNLWNALCEQAVDPVSLAGLLASKNSNLVLGLQCVYEMARLFRASNEQAANRGRELFSYLKKFTEIGTPCVKETMELLAAEMLALKWQVPTINPTLGADDYDKLKHEISKLADGFFDEQADKFIKERMVFASITRHSQTDHLTKRADMRHKLKRVLPVNLEVWLDAETLTLTGAALLAGHIKRTFHEAPQKEVVEYALALLGSPASHVAKGLVRADLYYNWRCAHRGSNPRDLVDDMFHVLNATYCDVYATMESRQSEYAGLLLTGGTKVTIYDGEARLDQWLVTLV